jgi:hypothetical protein
VKKTVSLFIFALSSAWMMGQTTKHIGTDTTNAPNEPPFGIFYGHERSAELYLYTEIGNINSFISIDTLRWQVATSDPNSYPIKIYLKTITATTLNLTTWESYFNGATLVYDGTAWFPATGWYTFDIADFVYYNNNLNNLLVLCETNWGGTGASSTPKFYYTTTTTNKNEWWYWYDPPADSELNKYRPNIQITYDILTGVLPPSGFMATSVSSSEIDLNWIKNSSNDNVMVAFDTTNTFGTPSGTYVAGNTISGGGTVVYNGSATSFAHTGLGSNTYYYYKAWSVHPSIPTYSPGTVSSATTFCDSTCMYPYTTDFESVAFPPSCWSLASVPWIRSTSASGYGAGTASAMADFYHLTNGNIMDIISPPLDLNSMPFPVIKFDHAYATDATHQVDSLQLWASNDYGESYSWLTSWAGGVNGPLNTGGISTGLFVPSDTMWATKTYALPAGTNKIMFRGVSAFGNNLYLDNITFYDTTCVTDSIPYSEGFDHYTIPTTGCVKVTNDNGDTLTWGTSGSYPRSVPNSMYITHNSSVQMNEWFFTPALNLIGDTAYTVNFYYRSGGAPSVEKLEVKWGSAQNSDSMGGGQIWIDTNIQTTTYREGSGNFTPSATGTYYIGWHGYSAANMSWLCVDDIHIDLASVTWNGTDSEVWSDPLNWTPNIVPNEYQNVTIPYGTPNDPTIYDTGLACKQLILNSGVTLILSGGSGLTIKGDLTIENGATLNNGGVIILKGNLINLN